MEMLQNKQKIRIGVVLKKSLLLYKDNFFLFIGILFLGYSLFLSHYLIGMVKSHDQLWISLIGSVLIIAGLLVVVWGSIALIIAIANRYENKKITIKSCFLEVKGNYWRYCLIALIYFLIVFVGLLIFVIPGIYWGVIFCLSYIVVVLEKSGNLIPFIRSKELVKGNFWRMFCLGYIGSIPFSVFGMISGFYGVNPVLMMISYYASIIFTLPFSLSISVISYYTLKEIKGNAIGTELKRANSKSGCCLGCLTAAGLIIIIVVLVPFIMGKFLKTETGVRVSEGIKERLSHDIILPGGVNLQRPEGWLAQKTERDKTQYNLVRFGRHKISKITIWSIPINELAIPKTHFSLDDAVISDMILDKTINREDLPETYKDFYMGYEPQPVNILELGDRLWGELTFKKVRDINNRTMVDIWRHIYTVFDDYIIIVSYSCSYRMGLAGVIERAEDEVKEIISTISFPKE